MSEQKLGMSLCVLVVSLALIIYHKNIMSQIIFLPSLSVPQREDR